MFGIDSKNLLPNSLNKSSIPEFNFAEVYLKYAPILSANSLPSSSVIISFSYKSTLFAAIPKTIIY